MTLGQIKVEEKTNEITAVPELLDMLDVEGSIITADAMSCQKAITAKIVECKADYVIGLKGNQGSLLEDVKFYFENERVQAFVEPVEKGHGRIEMREYFLETDIAWLSQKQEWTNLNAIGAVRSTVEEKGVVRHETPLFHHFANGYKRLCVCSQETLVHREPTPLVFRRYFPRRLVKGA
jgi:predicted transposase YbfD/YdcC